jgi:uncharacterized protein YkwD
MLLKPYKNHKQFKAIVYFYTLSFTAMHYSSKLFMLFPTFCLFVNVFAQTQQLDYYQGYDHRDFRKEKAFLEQVNFEQVDIERINAVLFHLTNETRKAHKLNPLSHATELEMAALMHARDMNKEGFFSHFNEKEPSKRTPNDRAKLCQVSNPFLAENIIEGFGLQYQPNDPVYTRGPGKFSKTAAGALIEPHTYLSLGETFIKGWMNSKDHRNNMLSKDALQLGCGVVYYVNHDFNDMPSFLAVQCFQLFQPIMRTRP